MCITVDHHYFFLAVQPTYIAMNIQPVDRLRMLSGILQLQNDRLLQYVPVHLDLAYHGRHRRLRRYWIRNWILESSLLGQYEVLVDQLLNFDLYGWRNFSRLSPELFGELVERARPVTENFVNHFQLV